jgi:hypothetical protein
MQDYSNYVPYSFHRADGFYFVTLKDDEDAINNAHHNPGTLRVEDIDGRVVWHADKVH